MPLSPRTGSIWVRVMPLVFVLIWSTGFIVARYGMPHAPPMTFLSLRFVGSLLCFSLWVAVARPAWPANRQQWLHLAVTGALMHAGYLGGVWVAVKAGMGSGVSALVVGLQPVLTAVWLAGTGGQVTRRQWVGLGLGLAGLVLVVARKFNAQAVGDSVTWFNLGSAVVALCSITAGTLYQKHFVQACDVRTAATVQLLAALLVTLPLAALETEAVQWHPEMIGALLWSVLGLTLGGSSLLFLLIQRAAASSVSSLMYLVPPCTACIAWVLFAEPITHITVLGMLVTAVGVSLVVRPGRSG